MTILQREHSPDGALLMTGCMMENLPMWIFQMILLIASLKNGRSQWD